MLKQGERVPSLALYRYFSHPTEISQVRDKRKVQTTNPNAQGTWYTPTRYDDPMRAQQQLALRQPPTHRIGPIPADEMPDFDIGLRPVAPANGQPGGGVEARAKEPGWLSGLWDFTNQKWEL